MNRRIFVEDLTGQRVRIEGSEAHHLLNVLRLSTGDTVDVFDGHGSCATGSIVETTRRDAVVMIEGLRTLDRRPRAELTVAACPPKGDRLKWMTEKLTELGVARLVLLKTERTIVNPAETKLEKLRASVIAACKQSRRNHLMQLSPLTPLDTLLQQARDASVRIVLAHPGITASATAPNWSTPQPETSLLLLIGPEGGFTEAEVQSIRDSGGCQMSWPGTILRIETAAVALAAVAMFNLPAVQPPDDQP